MSVSKIYNILPALTIHAFLLLLKCTNITKVKEEYKLLKGNSYKEIPQRLQILHWEKERSVGDMRGTHRV